MTDTDAAFIIAASVLHAAADAAALEIYEYAHRFDRRADYLPLEELASRVQRAAVVAGRQAWQRAEGDLVAESSDSDDAGEDAPTA